MFMISWIILTSLFSNVYCLTELHNNDEKITIQPSRSYECSKLPGIATEICGLSSHEEKQQELGRFYHTPGNVEDEIVFSKEQNDLTEIGDEVKGQESGEQRVVIKPDESKSFDLWPPGEKIPYKIDPNIGKDAEKAIKEAISDIEKFTCIRFKQREAGKDKYFLKFVKGESCSSYIGRRKDFEDLGQKVTIAETCETKGDVIHEILHSFGFLNEHTREDRDIYVQINWENIIPGPNLAIPKIPIRLRDSAESKCNVERLILDLPDKKRYFKVRKQFVQNYLGQDYDYNSIMHYGRKQYTKNGEDTISIFGCRKKAKERIKMIGQRKGMSAGDRFQINKLFKCPEKKEKREIRDEKAEESKDQRKVYSCSD